jgi:glycerol-3-phosphate dehydrogenase
LKATYGPEDIISIRCGVRPLAVEKSYSKNTYPLELSRKYQVAVDRDHSALAVYGGKLTACSLLADKVAARVEQHVSPTREPATPRSAATAYDHHPMVEEPQVCAEWSRDHEFCLTLGDYLRRRTNISQWTPRMGLGRDDEHEETLLKIARQLTDNGAAEHMLADHIADVHSYDQLLQSV